VCTDLLDITLYIDSSQLILMPHTHISHFHILIMYIGVTLGFWNQSPSNLFMLL